VVVVLLVVYLTVDRYSVSPIAIENDKELTAKRAPNATIRILYQAIHNSGVDVSYGNRPPPVARFCAGMISATAAAVMEPELEHVTHEI
jgi:hypothetical protein